MKHPLDCLLGTEDDARVFGEHWCGPFQYNHWKKTHIASFKGDGDGVDVEVFCKATPARFYEIQTSGFVISTGSGQAKLAYSIAKALSEGMLEMKHV